MWVWAAEKVIGGLAPTRWWGLGDWFFFLMAFYQAVIDLYAKVNEGIQARQGVHLCQLISDIIV